MARTYRLSAWRRVANWLTTRLLRLGIPLWNTYLLTVPGRKTGIPRTTPVTLAVRDGRRYLVAPYGIVSWVRNARAAGFVTLSRGRVQEHVDVTELSPDEAAPILKQYIRSVPIVRPFFDATADSSVEAFRADAIRKAVFRLN